MIVTRQLIICIVPRYCTGVLTQIITGPSLSPDHAIQLTVMLCCSFRSLQLLQHREQLLLLACLSSLHVVKRLHDCLHVGCATVAFICCVSNAAALDAACFAFQHVLLVKFRILRVLFILFASLLPFLPFFRGVARLECFLLNLLGVDIGGAIFEFLLTATSLVLVDTTILVRI